MSCSRPTRRRQWPESPPSSGASWAATGPRRVRLRSVLAAGLRRGCSDFPAAARTARLPWLPLIHGEPSALPLYVSGQRVPPQLTLLESPIRDGAVLSLGSPEGCVTPEPGGLVEIRVVSGPGAGSIYRLPAGYADIGSGPVDVRLWDEAVAPRALRVFADGRGRCQVAPYEGVQAALDREPLAAPAQWQPGQLVAVGRSLLGLAYYRPPDAALHPSADGCGHRLQPAAAAAAAGAR